MNTVCGYQANRYYTYEEMTTLLRDLTREHPGLMILESAGQSIEGREIWAVTVTDLEIGQPADKPAVYIDANIHAGEVSGTQVCLHTIVELLQGYKTDAFITEVLRRCTFYILPRTNPDGAELFLTTPTKQWGSVRPYPLVEDPSGWEEMDIDNNGEIHLIRMPNPNGEWKISEHDPRLMVSRGACELFGDFYSILPEGQLVGDAEVDDFKVLPRSFQLNLNRNFPAGWQPEALQSGGGEYPLSEPECKAVIDFILAHPNIGICHAYHTYGGLLMRPFGHLPDSEFDRQDLQAYNHLGEIGEQLTGYPMVSVYESFTTDKKSPRRGVLHDWSYNHMGHIAIGTEIWNFAQRAGVKRADPNNYYPFQEQSEADEITLLHFNDERLGGAGFCDWEPFEHPQLGSVEIGGWRIKFTRKNPPVEFLEDECIINTRFNITYPAVLPRVEIKHAEAKLIGPKQYSVRVVVENTGYLPTHITKMALDLKVADPVKACLHVDGDVSWISGREEQTLGHLPGRMRALRGFFFNEPESGIPRRTATARWIVQIEDADISQLRVKVGCPRAGTAEMDIELPR